jgi:hypothetical protein
MRLQEFNLQEAKGLSVRQKFEFVEGELPSVYALAQEGCHGRSPGLQQVKREDGTVASTKEDLEEEITKYFERFTNKMSK